MKPIQYLFAISLLSTSSLFAGLITLSGDTTGKPTYNRTTETGSLSFVGDAVPYDYYKVDVTQTGSYTFTLTATDPSSYDTFLHLYVGIFNAADPEANFLTANDPGTGFPDSPSVITYNLATGTDYYAIADGFLNSDAGAYTLTISGPGDITAVPEPGNALYALTAMLGMTMQRFRRRTTK